MIPLLSVIDLHLLLYQIPLLRQQQTPLGMGQETRGPTYSESLRTANTLAHPEIFIFIYTGKHCRSLVEARKYFVEKTGGSPGEKVGYIVQMSNVFQYCSKKQKDNCTGPQG